MTKGYKKYPCFAIFAPLFLCNFLFDFFVKSIENEANICYNIDTKIKGEKEIVEWIFWKLNKETKTVIIAITTTTPHVKTKEGIDGKIWNCT